MQLQVNLTVGRQGEGRAKMLINMGRRKLSSKLQEFIHKYSQAAT